jgi:hypothetical protein
MEVIMMEGKPIHYDGSVQSQNESGVVTISEPFILTDEMRTNLSGNPFISETTTE